MSEEVTVFEFKAKHVAMERPMMEVYRFMSPTDIPITVTDDPELTLDVLHDIQDRKVMRIQTGKWESNYIVCSPEVEEIIGFTMQEHVELEESNGKNFAEVCKLLAENMSLKNELKHEKWRSFEKIEEMKSLHKMDLAMTITLAVVGICMSLYYMAIA